MAILTKSKYLLGLQCPKLLWTAVNDKEKIPNPDSSAQHKFEQGTLVGVLATKWFPEGINLADEDYKNNLKKTEELLKKRKPLFEASFEIDNLFSRADILNPAEKEQWDIIEVKSSTKVKDVNIEDVSFQKYIYEKFGLKIRKCFLMHINNQYVKKGEIEPKELFVLSDITEEVEKAIGGIQERINNLFKIINSKKKPEICIGKYCKDPYECGLKNACWEFLPKENVFELYLGGKKSFELYDKGILEIKNIPREFKLNERQRIQRECAVCGKPNVIKEKIKSFLDGLNYPLYYLDFETFNPAVPKYDGMKPYQRIGFQYSLHVVEKPGAKPKHISFLADGMNDPRPKFLQSLKDNLGKKGDIIVYNESFEKGVFTEHTDAFLEFQDWLSKNIMPRIKDLLIPFRQFHYYDPKQCGSASIKKVLPVMSDLSYNDMEINNGGDASIAYENATYGNVSEKEKKKIRDALEKYCELDTLAEIKIIDRLMEIVK
ncbi:MAG: DUF2779 domain-containing protein [Nanoarchaeota archaeon]|nr:DUF2779 domain-containing protein [Nanoarchaeota archaeon]